MRWAPAPSTLDGGGFEVVVGSGDLTVANNFKIGTGNAGIGNGGTTLTLTGVISDRVPGNGSELLVHDGTGTFSRTVFSGVHTYTGGTLVTGAVLQADNSSAVGTGRRNLDPPVRSSGSNNLSFSNEFRTVANTANAIDNGGHTLTISGKIVDYATPGAIEFDGAGTTVLTGEQHLHRRHHGLRLYHPAARRWGYHRLDRRRRHLRGALAFNRSDSASTPYVFAGVISGGGVVKQIGSGTVELSGANTYSGGTVISDGTVRVTNSDPGTSSSVGTGTVTLDGGKFQAGVNNLNFNNTFEVNTTGGTIDTNGHALTSSGTIQDGNGLTGVLTKTGAGTLILTGSNSYSGGTALTAGTLSINNGSAIGTGDLAMAEGTALKLDGTFTLNNNINIAGDPIFDVTTGNTVDIAGVISDAPSPAPAGIVEKLGGGTLVLSGVNTYSGGTVISAGILRVTNDSSVGSGNVALDGGTFQADGVSDLTFANSFTINTPGGTIDNNLTILTLSGNITNGSVTPGLLTLTGGSGFGGITVLAGNNSYSGGTAVLATTVQVTNANSLGTGAVTLDWGTIQTNGTDVTLNNNITLADTISFGGFAGGFLDSSGARLTIAGNITGAGALEVLEFWALAGNSAVVLLWNQYRQRQHHDLQLLDLAARRCHPHRQHPRRRHQRRRRLRYRQCRHVGNYNGQESVRRRDHLPQFDHGRRDDDRQRHRWCRRISPEMPGRHRHDQQREWRQHGFLQQQHRRQRDHQ